MWKIPRVHSGNAKKAKIKKSGRASQLRRAKPPSVTQHDVARLAGVSQSAVSRVYGKGSYVAEEVRKRVEAAARQLRYQPDALARGLITGRSGIVAIVMADIVNPFYPYVLDLLTAALQTGGRQALFFNAARNQSIDDLIPAVLQYRVMGIVIATASLPSRAATLCADKGVPVVMFNRYARMGSGHAVACDNLLGGQVAADTLLAAGCSNVVYIGGAASSSTNEDRKHGFLGRLGERRVLPLAVIDRDFTYEWGSEAVDQLIAQFPQLDGIFCGDDAIAFGAIDSLRYRHARQVPTDVSVIGFDDIPSGAWPAYNLTTIRQPVEEMVETALACLSLPPESPFQVWKLPGSLISRGTVRADEQHAQSTKPHRPKRP